MMQTPIILTTAYTQSAQVVIVSQKGSFHAATAKKKIAATVLNVSAHTSETPLGSANPKGETMELADGPPCFFRLAIAKHLLHLNCAEGSRQCQMSPPLNTMDAQCPHLDATGHTADAGLEENPGAFTTQGACLCRLV